VWSVLVDDFVPRPLQGDAVWFYTRIGTDRGQIDVPGTGSTTWGDGHVDIQITNGATTFRGVFFALKHLIRENRALDFRAIFPPAIEPAYQGAVTAIRLRVADGRGTLRVELQAPDGRFVWSRDVTLTGGAQEILLPVAGVDAIRNLNCVVIGRSGDFVRLVRVELVVDLPDMLTPRRAFLWSYAMLLDNFEPTTGLTRDRSNFPMGDFENVSATGMTAAATVMAWRARFVTKDHAADIVEAITTGLVALPRHHGVWPHFVELVGGVPRIKPGTEWASLDTILALLGLLEAREALGLPTAVVEQLFEAIDWADLTLPDGTISHGYSESGELLPSGWDVFGGESWLAAFGHASATGTLPALTYPKPPTFNGSGFIDELASLFSPGPLRDPWGVNWVTYRAQAARRQIGYYVKEHPAPCYSSRHVFGLSAAEVPDPAAVAPPDIYQPFGVGGRIPANDGTVTMGQPVVVPHYAALVAAAFPRDATRAWQEFEAMGVVTPLNNAESLMITSEPGCGRVVWNSLHGSLNLTLQTLGWGRAILGSSNPLPRAMQTNDFLRQAWRIMSRAR
jgi:hypothetical protein